MSRSNQAAHTAGRDKGIHILNRDYLDGFQNCIEEKKDFLWSRQFEPQRLGEDGAIRIFSGNADG